MRHSCYLIALCKYILGRRSSGMENYKNWLTERFMTEMVELVE